MQIRTHQECRMGLDVSNKKWHKPKCYSRDRLQVVHIFEKQMFTGHLLRMAQIGQRKIFVNTMWSSIFLTSLNLFKHHQQSVCAIIIITTTTILPRGCRWQVVVYFTIYNMNHMNDAEISIKRIAWFLIPSDMMNNGHDHTKIQAYAHSQRHSKMITINYIKGNIVHYSPLFSFGARHYG